MAEFTTGPVIDKPKPPAYVKPQRLPELYTGEPPQTNDGKTPQTFTIQKKCELDDVDQRTKKKFKCQQRLQVVRVKNQVFEKDESGYGGQLIYDEKDMRQYVTCPIHGGIPTGYDRWVPGEGSKL